VELFPNEKLTFDSSVPSKVASASDDNINEKYIKGEVRIVTEQARYPLRTIPGMLDSDDYELNPEFQRRHRWDNAKKSRLIESFIMNVPIPPIFLYEDSFSHYEVMDGLQRLTAIYDFYKDRLELDGLEEWPELNGRRYSELPDQVKRGIDRRYLSSIILLQETAKNPDEAQRLKQLVFERINSGGVRLEPQESRNAIYNGPLNKICIDLSRNQYLCRTWAIPEPTEEEILEDKIPEKLLSNEHYRKMNDIELVLRFFAYRQRLTDQRGSLKSYLDRYLLYGNSFEQSVLDSLRNLFQETIELVYETFGEKAFWLWRFRNGQWGWFSRATIAVYDPMMYVFSGWLSQKKDILSKKDKFREEITVFYEKNYATFEGRSVNRSDIEERNNLLNEFVTRIVSE